MRQRTDGAWRRVRRFRCGLVVLVAVMLAGGGIAAKAQTLAVGLAHACEVSAAGVVRCWGGNYNGEVGVPASVDQTTPARVDGVDGRVTSVAVGGAHTCASTTAGAAWCWGANRNGQLGDGSLSGRHQPAQVAGLSSGVAAIAADNLSTCAQLVNGGVKCWGSNWKGQLGDGTNVDRSEPVDVIGLGDVVSVRVGSSHVCALTQAGAVSCWGSNHGGALGDGMTADRWVPGPVSGLDSGVVSIEIGNSGTCATLNDGAVKCWGGGRAVPTLLDELEVPAIAMAIGYQHRCALTAAGQVLCWGSNDLGQIGDGSATWRSVPTPVAELPPAIIAVASKENVTCAKSAGGSVHCWGDNLYGQHGNGTRTRQASAVEVVAVAEPFDALAVGMRESHAIAAGKVYRWGLDEWSGTMSAVPQELEGLGAPATSVAAGFLFGCASQEDGRVQCWGVPPAASSSNPTEVLGLGGDTTQVFAGSQARHACAVDSSGALYCWGRNDFGELGDGTTLESQVAVAVAGLDSGVVAATAGSMHTCALTTMGSVKCWGSNASGQLGNGSFDDAIVPTDVVGLDGIVVGIAAGMAHTCAVMDDGAMKCWGEAGAGQLGHSGGGSPQPLPVEVDLFPRRAAAVSAGYEHTCATVAESMEENAEQTVLCWGGNYHGQLGTGNFEGVTTPMAAVVDLAPDVVQTGAGFAHSCALTASGLAQCWGYNQHGELGNGEAGPLLPTWVPGTPFDDALFHDGFDATPPPGGK